jgi:O-antigen ligase
VPRGAERRRDERRKVRPTRLGLMASGDATTLLSGFIVLLIGIPASYVFGPLGGAGAPSQLLGMGAALWWAAHRVSRYRDKKIYRQPIRIAMLAFVGCVLASYIAASIRPIDSTELQSADRGLLNILAWLGILVVCMDGIPSRERLDTLLRRVACAGGAIATLGLVQFETGKAWTNYLQIPGLSMNSTVNMISQRDGLSRPFGTATHPIEFGVALTMFLPIALHYALVDTHRKKVRRWYPVVVLALAIPVSISRSAILCSAVVLAFILPTLPDNIRKRAYAATFLLAAFIYVTVPGMIGTVLGLFTGIGSDTSAQSRTGSYGIAFEFIRTAPIFGRGFATFLPKYHILDNQYLGTLIELGVVGLSVLLILFLVGIGTGLRVRQRSADPDTRQLAQALTATVASTACAYALFDAFSFSIIPGLLFLCLGAIAALRRLEAEKAEKLRDDLAEDLDHALLMLGGDSREHRQ